MSHLETVHEVFSDTPGYDETTEEGLISLCRKLATKPSELKKYWVSFSALKKLASLDGHALAAFERYAHLKFKLTNPQKFSFNPAKHSSSILSFGKQTRPSFSLEKAAAVLELLPTVDPLCALNLAVCVKNEVARRLQEAARLSGNGFLGGVLFNKVPGSSFWTFLFLEGAKTRSVNLQVPPSVDYRGVLYPGKPLLVAGEFSSTDSFTTTGLRETWESVVRSAPASRVAFFVLKGPFSQERSASAVETKFRTFLAVAHEQQQSGPVFVLGPLFAAERNLADFGSREETLDRIDKLVQQQERPFRFFFVPDSSAALVPTHTTRKRREFVEVLPNPASVRLDNGLGVAVTNFDLVCEFLHCASVCSNKPGEKRMDLVAREIAKTNCFAPILSPATKVKPDHGNSFYLSKLSKCAFTVVASKVQPFLKEVGREQVCLNVGTSGPVFLFLETRPEQEDGVSVLLRKLNL